MKRALIVIIVFFSSVAFLAGQDKAGKAQEIKVPETDRLKAEIRELVDKIKVDNDKARSLFDEAKIKADSLKQESEQKLAFLESALASAVASKSTDKNEIGKASALNLEARKLYQGYNYEQAIKKANEALGHISDIPVVSVSVIPQLFSPDERSKNTLNISRDVFSIHKVTSWTLFVNKKEENDKEEVEVTRWSGAKLETQDIIWDGKVDGKMMLDSASSYVVELVAKDEKNGTGRSGRVNFKTDIFTTGTERGHLINISSIKFDYNKAVLKTEYKKLVKRVYNFLLQYPDYSIVVEGHSDSSGKAVENQALSAKRAETVANYLVELGMDKARIKTYGLGEALPSTDVWKKMALNRRVSFILLKTTEDLDRYESFIKQLDLAKEVLMKDEPGSLRKTAGKK